MNEQAKGPVQAGVETNATPKHVEDILGSIPKYVESFARALTGEKEAVTFAAPELHKKRRGGLL